MAWGRARVAGPRHPALVLPQWQHAREMRWFANSDGAAPSLAHIWLTTTLKSSTPAPAATLLKSRD